MKILKNILALVLSALMLFQACPFTAAQTAYAQDGPVFTGFVCDENGDGVPGVTVTVYQADAPEALFSVQTDDCGAWTIESLFYQQAYRIKFIKEELSFQPRQLEICENDPSVDETQCKNVLASETAPTETPGKTPETDTTAEPDGTAQSEATEETAQPEETVSPEAITTPEAPEPSENTVGPKATPALENTVEPVATAETEETAQPEETVSPEATTTPEAPAPSENTVSPKATAAPDATDPPGSTAQEEPTPAPETTKQPSSLDQLFGEEPTSSPTGNPAAAKEPTPQSPQPPEATETPEPTVEAPEITEPPEITDIPADTEPPEATETPVGNEQPIVTASPEATTSPVPAASPEATKQPSSLDQLFEETTVVPEAVGSSSPEPEATTTTVPEVTVPAEPAATPEPLVPLEAEQFAYIAVPGAGLYPAPDEGAAPCGTLAENESVSVLSLSTVWAFIRTPDNTEGYVPLESIRVLQDSPAAEPASSGKDASPLTLSDFGLSVSGGTGETLQREQLLAGTSGAGTPSYLHPQTLVISADNENNSHSGSPDGDIDNYLYNSSSKAPIEVRFDISTLPVRCAHLAIYSWDCDENNGNRPEYDAVYVNGHKAGVLTGENQEWNTTLISVPVEYLTTGANYVTIHIGRRDLTTGEIFEDYTSWAIRVKWIQFLLDGGGTDSGTDTFDVEIQNAELNGSLIDCRVHVTIVSEAARSYEVEYSLVDNTSAASASYLQIIASDANTVTGSNLDDYGTLSLDLNAASGEYLVQVLLRDADTEKILATDEVAFDFTTGVVPSFDITGLQATQDPYEYTSDPVTVSFSAQVNDPDHQITDVGYFVNETAVATTLDASGQAAGRYTATRNDTYLIELRYRKSGQACSARLYYIVDNIVKNIFSSAQLSPSSATAGSTFTVTAVVGESVSRIDALSNAGNTYTGASSLTDNGDGTRTYSFSYVESSAANRTWTLTAYDANGTSLGAACTNVAVISAASTTSDTSSSTSSNGNTLQPVSCNGIDICTGTAQINVKAPLQAGIVLSGTAKHGVSRYEIRQGGEVLASSTTGTFVINNNRFTPQKSVVGYMITKDGGKVSQRLNIVVVSMSVTTVTLDFLDGIDTTFPHNIDLLGGVKFTIPGTKASSKSGSSSTSGLITQSVGNDEITIGIGMEASQSLQRMNDGLRKWHIQNGHTVKNKDIGISAMGYIIVAFDETGVTSVTSDVGVYLKGSKGFTKQVCASPPLVVDVSLAFQAGASFRYGYNEQANEWISPAVSFSGELTVTIKFGAGCAFLSAGVYGKCKGELEGQLMPVTELTKISLSGEVGVYVKFNMGIFKYTKDYTLLKVKKSWPLSADALSWDATAQAASPYDLTAYRRASRSYLANRSAFCSQHSAAASRYNAENLSTVADSQGEYAALLSDVTAASVDAQIAGYATLQTSVYDGIAPQIVTAGDLTIMAYLDDDGNTDDTVNYQHLVYSLWNGTDTWSLPRSIDDNDLIDAEFRLYASGSDVYAVYCEASRPLSQADLPLETDDDATVLAKFADIMSLMEIVVSKYDPDTMTFRRIGQLTSDKYYDYLPNIAVVDGVPTVAWTSNLDNDVFGTTGHNNLYRSVYDEPSQTWTTTTLAQHCTAVTSLALGVLAGQETLAVILDTDNDLLTTDDRQVTLYSPDGSAQAVETGVNDGLSFETLQGTNQLVWYADGGLHALQTGDQTPETLVDSTADIAANFQLLTVAGTPVVLYTLYDATSENGGSELYALYIDRSQDPVLTVDAIGYIDAFYAFDDSGALDIAFRRTDATFMNNKLSLNSDLCFTRALQGTDLQVDTLEYGFDPQTGNATLFVGVVNAGTTGVSRVTVSVSGQSALSLQTDVSLAPGGETVLTIADYPLPTSLENSVTVQVLPEDGSELTPADNTATLSLAFADFAVEARQYTDDGHSTIAATVANNGTVSGHATLNVRRENETGEIVYSRLVTLNARSTDTLSIPMNASDTGRYYVEILSDTAETDTADNHTTVTLYRLY